jgi:hypothetical protein
MCRSPFLLAAKSEAFSAPVVKSRRTHDRPGLGQAASALHAPGLAEVGYVRLPAGIEQNVGGLQVAVDDAPLVRVVDSACDRRQQSYRFGDR